MKATLRNIRITPKKMNLVADMVRRMNVANAEQILTFTPKKGAKILKKLLLSAVANAENNFKQSKKNLIIREIKVSKGETFHRAMPGGKGSSNPIIKYSSNIHVFVEPGIEKPEEAKIVKGKAGAMAAKPKNPKSSKEGKL